MNTANKVLENLTLFAALTRIPGTECLAESASKGTSRTSREVQKFVNPKRLSGFKAMKSELFRLCRSYGTKIDVLDAWGVPLADAPALTTRIEALQQRWNELASEVAVEWDTWVNEWARDNPDYRDEIIRLAPKSGQIEKRTKFVFASYRLTPEQIASGSLDDELCGLHEQAAHEIAMQIRETYPDIMEIAWDTKVFRGASLHGLLDSIARKAEGLGFLNPRLAEIPGVLHQLQSQLPKVGVIDGLPAIGIRSVLEQLSQSRRVLERGLHLPSAGDAMSLDLEGDDAASPLMPMVAAIEAPAEVEVMPVVAEAAPVEVQAAPVVIEVAVESVEVPALAQTPEAAPVKMAEVPVTEPKMEAQQVTEARQESELVLGYGW